MTEKPLGFGYQVAAGAIAGVSEVSKHAPASWIPMLIILDLYNVSGAFAFCALSRLTSHLSSGTH